MSGKRVLTPVIDPDSTELTVAEAVTTAQGWVGDVLVPITQNLLGGAAVTGLSLIAYIARSEWYALFWTIGDAILWCVLAGATVTCIMTVLRFFGDDLGLIVRAYRAGQKSMIPRISALEVQLSQATDAVASTGTAKTSEQQKALETLNRARDQAERIIRLHFEGEKVDRKSMASRGIGQRDWERARRLLIASGVLSDEGAILFSTPAECIVALNSRFKMDENTKRKISAFTPSW